MGTSTSPALHTLPTSENTLVPGESSVPIPRNQSAPLSMIRGTFAKVSTLLMIVGQSQSPLWDVR